MSPIRSLRRCVPITLGASATIALSIAAALPAAPAQAAVQFDTTLDLMSASGLSGTVYTAGDEFADDGAGMSFSVSDTLPDGIEGNIAIPLADDTYAVPQGLPTSPTRTTDSAAVEDLISRAQTFYDAGSQLVWDSSRPTPLTGTVVHSSTTAPYGVTCSTFVSMVLLGWDYDHTTYVSDQNTQVGYAVDFGVDPTTSKIWRANNLASWFYANGDLWMETGADGDSFERGDILFFSQQDPEGRIDQVRSGTESTYFGNVYHAAIYMGDGMLIHSTGTGDGVNITTLNPVLKQDLSFVARPSFTAEAANTGESAGSGSGTSGSGTSAGQGSGTQSAQSSAAPTAAATSGAQSNSQGGTTGTASPGNGNGVRAVTPVSPNRRYSRPVADNRSWMSR
ncbi:MULTISPECIES: C40 family peptidase [Actinomyces]|uniref:C40 family peptidase n=1 Tax=Actinomyces TaxID=1654 RepID=UPI00109DA84B|nr:MULTISPECIES: C40 family peptidase [Actinomyces]